MARHTYERTWLACTTNANFTIPCRCLTKEKRSPVVRDSPSPNPTHLSNTTISRVRTVHCTLHGPCGSNPPESVGQGSVSTTGVVLAQYVRVFFTCAVQPLDTSSKKNDGNARVGYSSLWKHAPPDGKCLSGAAVLAVQMKTPVACHTTNQIGFYTSDVVCNEDKKR